MRNFLLLAACVLILPLPPVQSLAQAPSPAPARVIRTDEYGGRAVVADRVLLKFRQQPNAADLSAVTAAASATRLEPLGGAGWYRLDSSSATVAQLVSKLSADTDVAEVEPDYVGYPESVLRVRRPPVSERLLETPNDPYYGSQWAFADINAPAAWDLATGSASVAILDLDTGIDWNNPDVGPNVWAAPFTYSITEGGTAYDCPQGSHGFNAMDGENGCSGGAADDDGHGTFMAGILGAATDNDLGIAGTNWNVSIISIKICSPCESSEAITGIDAAMQIAARFYSSIRVVAGNLSHGDIGGSALEDEMQLAGQEGVVFAASTGNECSSGADDPASFHLANELAVAGNDQSDNVAYWDTECSNGGGDISAPGSDVYTTVMGDDGTHPAEENGTSVSAPLVTGAVALLYSACPLTPEALVQTVEGTADLYSSLSSIATDGRHLDLGSALGSCAGGGHTPGTAALTLTLRQNLDNPDFGTVYVTIDGMTSSYDYDTSIDTLDSLSEGLANNISGGGYVIATYEGNGHLLLTTTARGPYTGYVMGSGVQNDCTTQDECGAAPTIRETAFAAGN